MMDDGPWMMTTISDDLLNISALMMHVTTVTVTTGAHIYQMEQSDPQKH